MFLCLYIFTNKNKYKYKYKPYSDMDDKEIVELINEVCNLKSNDEIYKWIHTCFSSMEKELIYEKFMDVGFSQENLKVCLIKFLCNGCK